MGTREKRKWANKEFEISSWINRCFIIGFHGGQECQKEKSRRFEVQELCSSMWRKTNHVSPWFPCFLSFARYKVPRPTHLYCSSLFLHYWRQRRKSSRTCRCGLVRFIRALLYSTRSSGTCCAVPVKIQPLFSMAPGNETPGYEVFTPMCTREKEHFLIENYCASPKLSTEDIYAPKSLFAQYTTATCGCSSYARLYFSSERCTMT